jgi:hypothetical protein
MREKCAVDAREFDELITRIAQASSRRNAVRGVLGGALAGAGVAAAADAKGKGKGKKGRKGKGKGDVASEHNAHNGKRTICLCQDDGSTTTTSTSTTADVRTRENRAAKRKQPRALVCETKRFKKKKAKKALRNNPGSYRGPCEDATTTTSTSTTGDAATSTTTVTSTSTTSTTPIP